MSYTATIFAVWVVSLVVLAGVGKLMPANLPEKHPASRLYVWACAVLIGGGGFLLLLLGGRNHGRWH
jgi:protein-S-isoprenylcysteine O-methyltransferase Ste14